MKIVCQCNMVTTKDVDKYVKQYKIPINPLMLKNLKSELNIGTVCSLCLNDKYQDTVEIKLEDYLEQLKNKENNSDLEN